MERVRKILTQAADRHETVADGDRVIENACLAARFIAEATIALDAAPAEPRSAERLGFASPERVGPGKGAGESHG